MEPWEIMISESQERMVAVVRPQMLEALTEVCERWELHCTDDRRGDRLRAPARLPRRRGRRRDPGAAAHRRVPALRHPAAAARPRRARRRRGGRTTRRRCSSCSPRRTSAAAPGSTSATTTSSARAPCAGRASTPPSCACARRCAGSRSRSTARGGSRRSTRAPAARSPCSRRRATSPARAASRSALTDCLNFGNPEKPEIAWELAEAIEGIAAARARRSGSRSSRATSRSTTTATGARSTRRRSSAASASSPTCGASPAPGRRATSSCSPASPSSRSPAPSTRRSTASSAATPAPLDLAAEAALVRFLWKAAPLLTLAHDVSDGGLAVCLAEAALHSGIGAELELPDGPLALFGEGGGCAVIACPAERRRAARLEGPAPDRRRRRRPAPRHPAPELREAWAS